MRENSVSIVVPVYNGERWLGYCLNSLLAQTWTRFEVILVNDGSTDRSLEICRNYAALDRRFRVLDVPNGGVSRARNLGVAQATGTYLAFVDSDDVVSPRMLELLVDCARRTGLELVAGDAELVDFADPDRDHPKLCAAWLGSGEQRLDRQQFAEKRMQLIWYTSLLESSWGKLFSLDLWRKLNLQFPPQLSLGEDFVTNMQYYAACNGIAFLNQTVYYYNNESQSDSLTHRHRPDLFQNKMFLIQRLREFLGPFDRLSQEEKTCYASYVACSGLKCLAAVARDPGWEREEDRLAQARRIVEDEMFRDACARNTWIPEEFVEVRRAVLEKNAEKALRLLRTPTPKMLQKKRRLEEKLRTGKARLKTGCKRALQKMLDPLQRANRYVNRLQTRELENRLGPGSALWQARLDRLEQQSRQTAEQLEGLQAEVQRLQGSVWEQTRQLEQQQVLALRQQKKAVLLGTAEHRNIGDAAIDLAEQNLLLRYFPGYAQVEISTYEMPQKYTFLQAIVTPQDILFLHGGGNLGTLYPAEEELHRRIVQDFPNNKIVILPQSLYFADTPEGRAELERSARVYNHHRDLTLFAREQASYDFARRHFPAVKTKLMADGVFSLRRDYGFSRSGILVCLRGDEESLLAGQQAAILDTVRRVDPKAEGCTNVARADISRVERAAVVYGELQRYARHRVVVTDRLHGLIFAAVTGTPCVVLDSLTGKSRAVYRTFLEDSNAVFWVGTDCTRLEQAIRRALAVQTPVYPLFDRALFDDLQTLR